MRISDFQRRRILQLIKHFRTVRKARSYVRARSLGSSRNSMCAAPHDARAACCRGCRHASCAGSFRAGRLVLHRCFVRVNVCHATSQERHVRLANCDASVHAACAEGPRRPSRQQRAASPQMAASMPLPATFGLGSPATPPGEQLFHVVLGLQPSACQSRAPKMWAWHLLSYAARSLTGDVAAQLADVENGLAEAPAPASGRARLAGGSDLRPVPEKRSVVGERGDALGDALESSNAEELMLGGSGHNGGGDDKVPPAPSTVCIFWECRECSKDNKPALKPTL